MTEGEATSTTSDAHPRTQLELEQYLKSVAQAMADAVNERKFDVTAPPYAGVFSSGFTASAPLTGGQLNLDQYLTLLRNLTAVDPGWSFHVQDLSCSIRDRVSAVVFSNYASTTSTGVVHRGVGALYFSLQGGRWLVVGYDGHDGLEGTESAF